MPLFQYKALQADGAVAEGQLEAAGRQEAFQQMAGLGLRPVSLAEQAGAQAKTGAALPGSLGSLSLFQRSARVSARALENFTRLLSSLLAAGVPLSRALVILYKEASTPAAGAKWKEIHDLVIDGMSLADAMAKSPETFPRVYTAMVQAGETGGFLDLVLAQIADFQSREKDLRAKVMAAMLYPCVLLFLALGVLVFLLTFFIPKFQVIFAGLGGGLALADPNRAGHQPRACGTTACLWPSGLSSGSSWFAAGLPPRKAGGFGRASCCARRWSGRWSPSSPWRVFAACWARSWAPACRWCRP